MKMRLKCEDPEKIVFTVTTTATAQEWEQFRDCLDEVVNKSLLPKTLVYGFRNQVNDLLAQARRIYWPADPPGDVDPEYMSKAAHLTEAEKRAGADGK